MDIKVNVDEADDLLIEQNEILKKENKALQSQIRVLRSRIKRLQKANKLACNKKNLKLLIEKMEEMVFLADRLGIISLAAYERA